VFVCAGLKHVLFHTVFHTLFHTVVCLVACLLICVSVRLFLCMYGCVGLWVSPIVAQLTFGLKHAMSCAWGDSDRGKEVLVL